MLYPAPRGVVRYGYCDRRDRLLSSSDPLSRTTSYSYDLASRLTGQTDALGRQTTLGYDAAGAVTTLGYSDGTTPNVAFAYDALGRRTSMTDGSYDSLGRLTVTQNGAGAVVRYGYDLGNQLTTITYPSGSNAVVTRGYDAAGRLQSSADWLNNTSRFGYDPDGNLTSISYPGGGVTAGLSYDGADQLSGLTYSQTAPPQVLLALQYQHTPAGTLAAATEGSAGTETYSYDSRDRLTGAVRGSSSTRAWNYDPATEVLTTRATLAGSSTTTSRGYNAASALLSLVQSGSLASNLSFQYDPRGNRTAQTDSVSGLTTSYRYNQANELTGLGAWSYTYDGVGLRVGKASSGQQTAFTWDLAAGLPRLLSDGAASYLYGPGGMLLEQIQGSTAYYYHVDQLGSVRLLTDSTGAVQRTYAYDAYGAVISSTGTVANPFGYAGEYSDAESGLLYLRARYYDPATQQFLTVDPRLAQTGQAYAYAGGSPTNATDPSGQAVSFGDDSGNSALAELYNAQRQQEGATLEAVAGQLWNYTVRAYRVAREIHDAIENPPIHNDAYCPFAVGTTNFRGPAARGFDAGHGYQYHHPDSSDAQQRGPDNGLFPRHWTERDIENSMRRAWTNRERIGTQESPDGVIRIRYRGIDSDSGLTLNMWYNATTKIVESGYPVDVPLEIPIEVP